MSTRVHGAGSPCCLFVVGHSPGRTAELCIADRCGVEESHADVDIDAPMFVKGQFVASVAVV